MKKQIKLMSISVALLVLAGCSGQSDNSQQEARVVWSYSNVTDKGMLFSDNEDRLIFLDFETMNEAVLCSKPNCTHSDSQSCSSFGMSNHPILYENKLYFFDTESVIEKDETFKDITTIYKSETDGTGRVSLCTVDDLSIAPFYRMVVKGNMVYFYMVKQGNDGKQTTGYDIGYFCSYDLVSDEFKKIEKIYEGYHSGAWIYGLWNNKIYFSVSYANEKIPFPLGGGEAEHDKYLEDMKKATIDEYKAFDIETGTVTSAELPEPIYVGKRYYAYEKEGGFALLYENGEEKILGGFEKKDSISVFNGIMFNTTKGLCAKLSEGGEIHTLKIPEEQSVEAYYNGSYIVKENILGTDGSVVKKNMKKFRNPS